MGKTIVQKDLSNVYSTNEIKIGAWIDGKPLYRKCFVGTLSSNEDVSASWVNPFGTNLVNIVNMTVVSNPSNNTDWSHSTYYKGSSDNMSITFYRNSNRLYVSKGSTYPSVGDTVCVIVEYTKTTD